MTVELLNMDCMDYLRDCEDNAFDLAIVDPPYGADIRGPCGRFERYGGGLSSANNNPPSREYFNHLWRASKACVIWGANYFVMPPCKQFVVWDKKQPAGASYAQAEYAWTNIEGTAKIYEQRIVGADIARIHPTQKPVKLYDWLLTNYAKPGQRILDTHLGSGSSAIAAHYFGVDFVGIEIDKDYYDAACKRFDAETAQMDLLGVDVS